jgi:uncharacterized protein YecT (DUF1311 family)
MYIDGMFRFFAPLLLLAVTAPAICQNEETKCCCSTLDMSVCLSAIHQRVDADLNDTYQRALKSATALTAQDVQNLREAERLWISYRDAACKAEYGLWGGGSGGPNARSMCLIRVTRQRIVDLKNAYLQEH